jgi:hypothetical protein
MEANLWLPGSVPHGDSPPAWQVFLRNLIARETLSEEPVRARPRRPSLARILFAPEPLAVEPEPPPRARRSLLRAIFAVETLPEEPVAPPRPRRFHWLRWLLSPEKLDPP